MRKLLIAAVVSGLAGFGLPTAANAQIQNDPDYEYDYDWWDGWEWERDWIETDAGESGRDYDGEETYGFDDNYYDDTNYEYDYDWWDGWEYERDWDGNNENDSDILGRDTYGDTGYDDTDWEYDYDWWDGWEWERDWIDTDVNDDGRVRVYEFDMNENDAEKYNEWYESNS